MLPTSILLLLLFATVIRTTDASIKLKSENFDYLCHGHWDESVEIGDCSRAYIVCGSDETKKDVEIRHCRNYHEVFVSKTNSCVDARIACRPSASLYDYAISERVDLLAASSQFCAARSGIFFVDQSDDAAHCSRQVLVCGANAKQAPMAITCQQGYYFDMKHFKCISSSSKSTNVCTSSQLYPISHFFIDETCSYRIPYDAQAHCLRWYIDCNTKSVRICVERQVYDRKQLKCRPPQADDQCRDELCINNEWQKVAISDGDACNPYYIYCHASIPILFVCKSELIFSTDANKCVARGDLASRCGQCRNGQMKAYGDCRRYRMCINGEWSEQKCADNQVYSHERVGCIASDRCASDKPTGPPEQQQPFDDYSTVACRHGESYRLSCETYVICEYGQYVEQRCAPDTSWSVENARCEHDRDCEPRYGSEPTRCTANVVYRLDCGSYAICGDDGMYKVRYCDDDSYDKHDPTRDNVCDCAKPVTTPAGPPSIAPPPSYQVCESGSKRANAFDCAGYSECNRHGIWIEKQCDAGMAYNEEQHKCILDYDCNADEPVHCRDGDRLPHDDHAHYCNRFYQCVNGAIGAYQCAAQHHFDRDQLVCKYVGDRECTDDDYAVVTSTSVPEYANKTECNGYGSMKRHADCGKYYKCVGNNYQLQTCDDNVYDATSKRCVSRVNNYYRCDDDHEYQGTCQEGAFGVYRYDCRLYYQCVHGGWMLRMCGAATAWNQSIKTCDHIGNVQTCNTNEKPY